MLTTSPTTNLVIQDKPPLGESERLSNLSVDLPPPKHKSQSNYALDEIEDGDSSWCCEHNLSSKYVCVPAAEWREWLSYRDGYLVTI